MKISKSEFTGTGEVYRFTLKQYAKSKSNIVTTVIVLLFALVGFSLINYFGGSSSVIDEEDLAPKSNITCAYINNQTDIPFSVADLSYGDVTFQDADTTVMESQTLGKTEILITVRQDGIEYLMMVRTGDSALSVTGITDAVNAAFSDARLAKTGVTDDQLRWVTAVPETDAMSLSDYENTDDEGRSFEERMAVQYGYAIIVLILCMYSSIYIIRAIVEEKASKLVELLMVSVRPFALILGKILAVMTYMFGLVFALILCVLLSGKVSALLGMSDSVSVLSTLGIDTANVHFGIDTVAIIVISLLLAYLTYSVMGGISGTCCSTMEDVESANSVVMLFVMASYIVSCFTLAVDGFVGGTIVSLIPFLSVFCAPVQYILGNTPFWVLLLSWVIQFGIIYLLVRFAGRVYADLLIYRGERVKLGKLLRMAKKQKPQKEVQ